MSGCCVIDFPSPLGAQPFESIFEYVCAGWVLKAGGTRRFKRGNCQEPASTRSKGRCQPKACESTGRVQILTAQTLTPVGALCSLMPRMPGITSITEPVFFNQPHRKSKNNELGHRSLQTPSMPQFCPRPATPPATAVVFIFPQKSASFHSFALCTFDPKCIGHHVWPCVCI